MPTTSHKLENNKYYYFHLFTTSFLKQKNFAFKTSLVNAYIGTRWKTHLIAWKSDHVILENKMPSIPKPGTKTTQTHNLMDFVGKLMTMPFFMNYDLAMPERNHPTKWKLNLGQIHVLSICSKSKKDHKPELNHLYC